MEEIMPNPRLPISEMFAEMVRQGYITPPAQMEKLRLPGAYPIVPSIIGYAIPELPVTGVDDRRGQQWT